MVGFNLLDEVFMKNKARITQNDYLTQMKVKRRMISSIVVESFKYPQDLSQEAKTVRLL